ncbi:Heavy metal-associated isoprenylated plant protein 26 [Rhynchospora pubera]|uniref:HMA domain-containing protein n=2 Tax=Rhynchospora TaxID=46332 RepID=A0A9Q0CLI3_9POAL|nr:hypothetical protein LUZ63_004709 [Rhynchospora breviuscula]KAJ4761529.1 Heavy metal-associated isoprenylated plant protein 26 [Rhynchospora pubera]KAJ4814010.1 Heavy metal-associated isoprenylated plant protein 26 [Rhynchospora pubera]
MGGSLGYFWDLFVKEQKYKKKQFNTVDLKIKMDCDGCELKVKKTLSNMKGVQNVEINRKQNKVTVSGFVEAQKVVKRAQSTGKRVEIWPYVPYNVVAHPYAPHTYDKRAPAGHVRNVEALTVSSYVPRQEDHLATLFSDDNPNACSLM